jgi:4a-hydroxytetrahydrobiopterin dehydratase
MATRAPHERSPGFSGWRRTGQSLVREESFRSFEDAIAFVDSLAREAADYLRRPDICIVAFNNVRLTITNPHHAGITQAELRLAEKVNVVIGRLRPGEPPVT